MKSSSFLTFCTLLVVSCLPACEKIQGLADSFGKKDKPAAPTQAATAGAKPKAAGPVAQPMRKDWMPEGVKRR